MNKSQLWIDEINNNARYGLKGKILVRKKSDFQEIIILKTEDYGNALMLDGCWMTSDSQEKYYHECLVHPALSSLIDLSNILIIGGGDGGTARECLKYKAVDNIDLVEIDKEVINLSKLYLKKIGVKTWSDKRLKVNIGDGLQWVRNIGDNYYDAIIIDSSDPSDFSNGLFSLEFYKECKRIMNKNGILATQSESPESFEEIHIKVCKSIKSVFAKVSTMYGFVPFYPSGIWSWTFASNIDNDNFLELKSKEIKDIEDSCDVWNLNYQRGALKMMPNKISKKLE